MILMRALIGYPWKTLYDEYVAEQRFWGVFAITTERRKQESMA
jgi:hypothetical protein